jgi:dethiobiotin synthetase
MIKMNNPQKKKSVWISATGTDVGKTLFSCLILNAYAQELNLNYWKPLQTGIQSNQSDSDFIREKLGPTIANRILPEFQSWKTPSAPSYASLIENQPLDVDKLIQKGREYIEEYNLMIEGAGGPLVPINDKILQIDLMKEWNLPVIIVGRTGLGTIHDTLATIESCTARGIEVLGFFLVGAKSELSDSNAKEIMNFSKKNHLGMYYINPDETIFFTKENSIAWDPFHKVKGVIQ